MPPYVALVICLLFIVWLCWTNRRTEVSAAIWIPVAWATLLSSRSVSLWFGGPSNPLEDTALDKALFVALIGLALMVALVRRRVPWLSVLRNNKWIILYFLYTFASVLWSENSTTAAIRWCKNLGNLVMVLIIMSETDVPQAMRVFFARWAYTVIPLSIIASRYFPHASRRYDTWSGQPVLVGLGLDKNTSAMTVCVLGLALFWLLLETRTRERSSRRGIIQHSLLLASCAWLLLSFRSATAIACGGAGAIMLLFLRLPGSRPHVRRLGAYAFGALVLYGALALTELDDHLLRASTSALGRNPTLHGRNEIWSRVLREDTNPFVGVGFYSFWTPDRNRRLSTGFYYSLGTAHNGYIETYLNHGLIGLTLLLGMLVCAIQKARRAVLSATPLGALRFTLLIVLLLNNITESSFDRLVPAWLTLLLVSFDPSIPRSALSPRPTFSQPALQPRSAPECQKYLHYSVIKKS